MTTQTQNFDQSKAEAFSSRLVDFMNGSALTLMISIGHRTGLFDTLATLAPSTSEEIADAARLNERYVREWLGAMVVGEIVEYDTDLKRYSLPPEHASFLSRNSAIENLAVLAQYIPLMGGVEDKIIDCFKNGGGVPYEAYGRFHEVMSEDSGQSVLPALLDSILPLAPGVTEQLNAGCDVLDIGCGRGRAMNLLAETFPQSRFTGYDLSEEAVEFANAEAERKGLGNVNFEAIDLTTFSPNGKRYQLITAFDAIHDQARPDLVLSSINKLLDPDGVFLMQDISGSSHVHNNMDHPIGPLLYTISCLHCMTVSLAQDGMGLGAMWGEERAREELRKAGFRKADVKKLSHDIQNSYYVVHKS